LKRVLLVVVLFVLAVPCLAVAQAQTPQPPKPGPAVQRMAFMLGSWQDQNENHQSPLGPAGKETGTSNCEWFTGNFQVVCRADSDGPTGKAAVMSILAWDAGRKPTWALG
jgi:hypothetical protein